MDIDHPLALLVGRDGYERVVRITDPPPPEYAVPINPPLQVTFDPSPPRFTPIPRRTFRLSSDTAPEHRWFEIYNEGRSKTPRAAFVYYEQ